MAVAVAAAAAAVWLGADILAGNEYSHRAIPVWNSIVRLGFFVTVGGLTASIRRRLDDEEHLADTDSLTGLANARSFYEKVDAEIVRQKRYRNAFTLVYIDLDNFKAVNDRWGHEAGDDLLVNVARILQQNTRASDAAARLGGDEFAVLFPMTGANDAEAAVTVLQGRLDDCMTKNLWPVTFSVGVVTFVGAPRDVREAVKAADDRMYAAKRRGKNCISYETRDGEGVIEHRSNE
jgi:diguanylate cyclase (GGDEF)-like protein